MLKSELIVPEVKDPRYECIPTCVHDLFEHRGFTCFLISENKV